MKKTFHYCLFLSRQANLKLGKRYNEKEREEKVQSTMSRVRSRKN